MIKTTGKHLVNVFLAAVVLFAIVSVAQPTATYAAASPVGFVNYQLLINQHPDTAQADIAYKAAAKQAQADFDAKSANMNENEKRALYQKLQQGIDQKQQELLGAIQIKINTAVKEVASAKGLILVVDKSAVVYGGQDITDDVIKKITGK